MAEKHEEWFTDTEEGEKGLFVHLVRTPHTILAAHLTSGVATQIAKDHNHAPRLAEALRDIDKLAVEGRRLVPTLQSIGELSESWSDDGEREMADAPLWFVDADWRDRRKGEERPRSLQSRR